MITHLFVYGTLRPGQQRWPFLEPFVTDEGRDESAVGTLYDTGNGYPAARFDGDGIIRGRVYSLNADRLTHALEVLDDVEGAVINLFERVAIVMRSGGDAWAYQVVDPSHLLPIHSGDWLSQ